MNLLQCVNIEYEDASAAGFAHITYFKACVSAWRTYAYLKDLKLVITMWHVWSLRTKQTKPWLDEDIKPSMLSLQDLGGGGSYNLIDFLSIRIAVLLVSPKSLGNLVTWIAAS